MGSKGVSGVYIVGNQMVWSGPASPKGPAKTAGSRDPVTLSLSKDGIHWDTHFSVRHGVLGANIDNGGSCPRYPGGAKGCGYQYPGAMIDVERQEMIVR